MNRKTIKVLMLEKGVTFSGIARGIGVHSQAVYYVVAGRAKSRRIEAALEAVFKMPVADIQAAWQIPAAQTGAVREAVTAAAKVPRRRKKAGMKEGA